MPTRILIADDNEIARRRLVEILDSREGWKVCFAGENGQQAVENAADLKPDLIVLDLAMPVMNGLQAARKIAEIMPAVPILIYTLHNSPSVELEAKKAGARKVVFKPDVKALLGAIEDLIGTKPDAPLAIASEPEAESTSAPTAPPTTESSASVSEISNETGEAETPLAASSDVDGTPLT
jgi:CheY-like chemotaxis protein